MAYFQSDNSTGQNPIFIGAGLFVGVALVIALVVAWAEGPGAAQVGAPESPQIQQMNAADGAQSEANSPPVEELSGNAVTPEETGAFVAPAEDSENTRDMETPSGLETDLVVDPDDGAKGGADPDGGAAPFYPTPSGPEGRDGDPLTSN